MKTDHDRPEMPTSQWSLIAAAQGAMTTGRRLALAQLLQLYYPALRAHLMLRMRLDAATADDVIQGFIADKILDRELLATAHPSKGRFRSLLLRSLTNYAIDVLRKRRSHVVYGLPTSLDLDAPLVEPVGTALADPFDVTWAREVLTQALRTMRAECDAQNCAQRWSLFQRRVLDPIFHDETLPAYSELVDEFQFTSPQQASNALITAKRHFQRVLCEVVREYTDSDDECARELVDLHAIVEAAGPLNVQIAEALPEIQSHGHVEPSEERSSAAGEMATLFLVESHDASPWVTSDFAGLWMHVLNQPLSCVVGRAAKPGLRRSSESESVASEVETVGGLLRQPAPSIESLVAIKEAARSYVRATAEDIPGEIATSLYFAAIAAALVHRQVRISKSDDTILQCGFEHLVTLPWLDENTLGLVQAALRIINQAYVVGKQS